MGGAGAARQEAQLFGRNGDSIFIAGVMIVIAATLALLGYYGFIFVSPSNPLNPFPPSTPAAVLAEEPAATPTLPPTWTPTVTNTPTPTSTATVTPTATGTATPLPTGTPIPTETPTETPVPPPTSTPGPTATPKPPLFTWKQMLAGPDCGWTGIFGVVWTVADMPLEGVQVRLWTDDGREAISAPTDVNGNYILPVGGEPVAARWYIEVLEGGAPKSPILVFETSRGCENGLQKYRIDWQRTE